MFNFALLQWCGQDLWWNWEQAWPPPSALRKLRRHLCCGISVWVETCFSTAGICTLFGSIWVRSHHSMGIVTFAACACVKFSFMFEDDGHHHKSGAEGLCLCRGCGWGSAVLHQDCGGLWRGEEGVWEVGACMKECLITQVISLTLKLHTEPRPHSPIFQVWVQAKRSAEIWYLQRLLSGTCAWFWKFIIHGHQRCGLLASLLKFVCLHVCEKLIFYRFGGFLIQKGLSNILKVSIVRVYNNKYP